MHNHNENTLPGITFMNIDVVFCDVFILWFEVRGVC